MSKDLLATARAVAFNEEWRPWIQVLCCKFSHQDLKHFDNQPLTLAAASRLVRCASNGQARAQLWRWRITQPSTALDAVALAHAREQGSQFFGGWYTVGQCDGPALLAAVAGNGHAARREEGKRDQSQYQQQQCRRSCICSCSYPQRWYCGRRHVRMHRRHFDNQYNQEHHTPPSHFSMYTSPMSWLTCLLAHASLVCMGTPLQQAVKQLCTHSMHTFDATQVITRHFHHRHHRPHHRHTSTIGVWQ
jgi:hypothetical protein